MVRLLKYDKAQTQESHLPNLPGFQRVVAQLVGVSQSRSASSSALAPSRPPAPRPTPARRGGGDGGGAAGEGDTLKGGFSDPRGTRPGARALRAASPGGRPDSVSRPLEEPL